MSCLIINKLDLYEIDTIFTMSDDENIGDEEEQGGLLTVTKKKIKRPKLYKVLLHNDDYTTMEFVVYILKKHFGKTFNEAQEVMLKVHNDGVGVCGIYTYEIAETKVAKVTKEAQENGHPLLCTCDPEE